MIIFASPTEYGTFLGVVRYTMQSMTLKSNKTTLVIISLLLLLTGFFLFHIQKSSVSIVTQENVLTDESDDQGGMIIEGSPLQIEYLRKQDYPGSDFVVEQTLSPGSNYERYIISYRSEGLKQYALLTVPNGEPPENGWPAIVFNHGYISPSVYKTTERYIAYTDGFSRNGYVLLKPDYRGHANSEGVARGGYSNSDYIIDVLNAYSSLAKYPIVNPDKIGMWGHSMGGWITQRAMVINTDIKAGVIWAGVVGGYDDLLEIWHTRNRRVSTRVPTPSPNAISSRRRWRTDLVETYGLPVDNQEFWNSISSVAYLKDMGGPIQLHHATGDDSVEYELSERLFESLEILDNGSELYIYQDDDHNLTTNFGPAMTRSIEFFDRYLK